MFTSLFHQVSPICYSKDSNLNPCTSRTWCARTTFPQKPMHLGFNHTQICFIQGVLKKCLNVRHKLGTCQTCKTCTLSFTHSGHAEQLLFSSLCSKVTLSLSHSLTLTLTLSVFHSLIHSLLTC